MSDKIKIDPTTLAAQFVGFEWNSFPARPPGFHCEKMQRAWRNRSPVTASGWHRLALALTGNSDHAGPLYAACGEFSTAGTFIAAELTVDQWEQLAKCLAGYMVCLPDKALTRYGYEQYRQKKPTKTEVCHKLFECLLIWRTGKAGKRADIWRITKEAEAAYRAIFRPNENPPE